MTSYSVIVPAHDEAGTIAATLAGIMPDATLDLVIVCNGCRDNTAGVARWAAPDARVIELAAASKTDAINYGLTLAHDGIVLVVDADTLVTRTALDAVAAALAEPGVMAASPAPLFDLDGSDRWVRAYYRTFLHHSYLARGVGGSGVWGMSVAGRAQLGILPTVIADDGYVRQFFTLERQRRVSLDSRRQPVRAIVRPPATLRALIRTEARWRAGDAQIRALLPRQMESTGGDMRGRMADVRAADWARYVLIKVAGRVILLRNRLFGTASLWHRDR